MGNIGAGFEMEKERMLMTTPANMQTVYQKLCAVKEDFDIVISAENIKKHKNRRRNYEKNKWYCCRSFKLYVDVDGLREEGCYDH